MGKNMFTKISLYLLTFLLASVGSNFVQAVHLYRDTNFGEHGVVITPLGSSGTSSYLTIDGDGKIVGVGTSIVDGTNAFSITRYNTDGTLDTTFGDDGVLTTLIGDSSNDPKGILVQDDGKIIICGDVILDGTVQAVLVRYLADGSDIDTTFGSNSDGIVLTPIGDGSVWRFVITLADGSLATVGTGVVSGTPLYAAAHFDEDGILDTSFGSSGLVTGSLGFYAVGNDIEELPDGRLTIAGYFYGSNGIQGFVAGYLSDGTLDTSWGDSGYSVVEVPDTAGSTLNANITQDTNLLVDGSVQAQFGPQALYGRFVGSGTSSGEVDTTFGTDGYVVTTDENISSSEFFDLDVQSDDKPVGVGQANNNFYVARYTTDGGTDTTWGQNGILIDPVGEFSQFNAVYVQDDGKVLAGGGSEDRFTIIRYLPDNAPSVTVTSPADGTELTSRFVTLSGISNETGLQVRVSVNSTVVATVTTDSDGNWNAGTSPLLVGSSGSVTAELLDGSTVIASNTSNFTINAADVIIINNPADDSTVSTSVFAINGVGSEASATVEVSIDGIFYASTSTNSDGAWSVGNSYALVNGEHTITADLIVAASTVATTTNTITVNAPDLITIDNPVRGATGVTSPVDISGTSTEGDAPVLVYSNSLFLGTVTTSATGSWGPVSASNLVLGDNVAHAELINSVGNVLAEASNDFVS